MERDTASTAPWEVPTHRLGPGAEAGSVFLGKLSHSWKEEMASRDSLSILVTLELRERAKTLLVSGGPRAVGSQGQTEREV